MSDRSEREKEASRNWGRQGGRDGSLESNIEADEYDRRKEEERLQREKSNKEDREYYENLGKKNESTNSSCWVATAYYGSRSHPNVVILKDLRSRMMSKKYIGPLVHMINSKYHVIGRSQFGKWWASEINNHNKMVRFLSRSSLSATLTVARCITRK